MRLDLLLRARARARAPAPPFSHSSLPPPLPPRPPPPTRRHKQKGALSARGEVLKAVVLTAEEEATLTTEQLVMLAEAGVVAE